MAKMHKYMALRGKTYSLRVPVPVEIQSQIGKKEITRSLGTRDLQIANARYPQTLGEIQKEFEIAKAKNDQIKPALLVGFDSLFEVTKWFHPQRELLEHQTYNHTSNDQDILVDNAQLELVELTSENLERRFLAVQDIADKILKSSGYPVHPKTGLANIDVADKNYRKLLDLLITAQIELKEYELSRLGEKIQKTPNGEIFWQHKSPTQTPVKSGLTLRSLIEEYMSVKGENVRAKTNSDKLAAFRYLTSIVGEDYKVRDLERAHFVEIRNVLKAFPKNATKLKELDGKSLKEKSQFAQTNKLPLMSKQNANKIIMRLKGLMDYAVALSEIETNPCQQLKFNISDAEKIAAEKSAFTDEQLNTLFKSEVYKPKSDRIGALYWAPLIALFHGLRMEEILLLTLKEIKTDDKSGLKYFDLTGFTTDDLKNRSAIRRVPFHPVFDRLGFAAFLAGCNKHKGKRLFPELKRGKGSDTSYRKRFSQKYSRYLKKVGVYTRQTTFHSFRRNFAQAVKRAKVPQDYENALGGWALMGGQKGTYIKHQDFDLIGLKQEIEKVDFPDVDISHLYID